MEKPVSLLNTINTLEKWITSKEASYEIPKGQ
jgi:hypothetical protein